MADFLDTNGLRLLWSKIKALVIGKADKVENATNGNFAGLDSNGNLTDSGYNEDSFANAINIKYAALKALRDGSNLVPGTWYRITDYTCSTIQEATYSAGHKFDVIVRADDESNLNENAYAAHHEGDTYFQDCKLEAWELKYCLDNDTNRFAWAMDEYTSPNTHQPMLQTNDGVDKWIWVRYPSLDSSGKFAWVQDRYSNGIPFNLYVEDVESLDTTQVILTDTETPEIGTNLLVNNQNSTKLINATYINRGVIYYMKDECDNIAPFDFKNILVTRTPEWFRHNEDFLNSLWGDEFEIPETDMLLYFLSWIDENGEVYDLSTLSESYFDEEGGSGKHVRSNEIKECTDYLYSGGDIHKLELPKTIIVADYLWIGKSAFCSYNKFGFNCSSNTLLESSYNTFDDNSGENIVIGSYNKFGIRFSGNTISGEYNTFGHDCDGNIVSGTWNSFGTFCFSNTISGASNLLGNNIGNNTFEGSRNTFVGNCRGIYTNNVRIYDCKFLGNIEFLMVEGIGGSSSSDGFEHGVKNAVILGGIPSVGGGRTIEFEKDIDRTQVACLDSNGQVVVYYADEIVGKADKTSVVTLAETSVTQELADNTIYQCSTLNSLTISIPNTVTPDYISKINFTSGSTATTLTAQNNILWRGDDVINGSFVPVANKRYVISLCADGTYAFADVKGYA